MSDIIASTQLEALFGTTHVLRDVSVSQRRIGANIRSSSSSSKKTKKTKQIRAYDVIANNKLGTIYLFSQIKI